MYESIWWLCVSKLFVWQKTLLHGKRSYRLDLIKTRHETRQIKHDKQSRPQQMYIILATINNKSK